MPSDRRIAAADLLFELAARGWIRNQAADFLERLLEITDVDVKTELAGDLRYRGTIAAHAYLAGRQRLANRQAPTLIQGRAYGEQTTAVQQPQIGVADVLKQNDLAIQVIALDELGKKRLGFPTQTS